MDDLAPGAVVAGCRIERLLGRGGMGAVYQAVDEKLGRAVALKVVAPERARGRATVDRFVREARAAAAVRHPNVVATFDLRETESGLAIVQELVPGRSLQERLASDGPSHHDDPHSPILEARVGRSGRRAGALTRRRTARASRRERTD